MTDCPRCPELRVLVCGGRKYNDSAMFSRVMGALFLDDGSVLARRGLTIIHGAQTGADTLAHQWAVANCARPAPYKAEWTKYGNPAGPIRNQRMIDEGRPDLVIAFPGWVGTNDTVTRARAAGIPVLRVEP